MSYQKKIGLGKGLGALLNDTEFVSATDERTTNREYLSLDTISRVKIEWIEVNPFQPRTDFDLDGLQNLSDSIKLQGLIQPITIRRIGINSYQLISGERRLRASKLAGLLDIPAYIRTANDQQMLEMALIENIQREDLNAIEVALSFHRMIEECNLKQEELAERVSKNRSTITNYLRLLKLPPGIQVAIRDGTLQMGHARALLSIQDLDQQLYVYDEIIKKGLSVRAVEEFVRAIHTKSLKKELSKQANSLRFQYQKIEHTLTSKFGSKVKLKARNKGKGVIEISFLSEDDLNRILEMLDW